MTSAAPAAASSAVTVNPAGTGTRTRGPDVAAVEIDQIAQILLAATIDTPMAAG